MTNYDMRFTRSISQGMTNLDKRVSNLDHLARNLDQHKRVTQTKHARRRDLFRVCLISLKRVSYVLARRLASIAGVGQEHKKHARERSETHERGPFVMTPAMPARKKYKGKMLPKRLPSSRE